MENASDALIMAASVLIVIVALSITISSFSQLINTVDEITMQEEILDTATDGNGELLRFYKADSEIRQVNASTVMTSIRRASSENYKVYICPSEQTSTSKLYKFITENSGALGTVCIESEKDQSYNNGSNNIINREDMLIRISLTAEEYKNLMDNGIMGNLYTAIKDSTFNEYVGQYQDAEGNEADKLTYRIITFVEQ